MRWTRAIRVFVVGGAALGGLVLGVGAMPGAARAAGGEPSTHVGGTGAVPGAVEVQPGTVLVAPGPVMVAPVPSPGEQQPSTAESQYYLQRGIEAQNNANAAREEAAALKEQGGQAYKIQDVQRAEREAVVQQAAADQYFAMAGVPSCQRAAAEPVPETPELKAAQHRLDQLKEQGGWAYKTGSVQRQERKVTALTEEARQGL